MGKNGECPDIYECRLGRDKVMRSLANVKLQAENARLRKALEEIRNGPANHMAGWRSTWVYRMASAALSSDVVQEDKP